MDYNSINNNLLSVTSNNIISSLFCDGDECLCWIIVLLNVLAVFYLVFCSFYNANRLTKIIGWIFGGILLCGTIAVVAIHTCLFTLLCAVFSVMIFMAVLSIVLPVQLTKHIEKHIGSYVIKRNDKGFVYSLYDASRKLLVSSKNSYASVAETKNAINVCKENGLFALVEDNTEEWQKQQAHPKFEIYEENALFYFRLAINAKDILFVSAGYRSVKICKYYLGKVVKAVGTDDIFILADIAKEYEVKEADKQCNEICNNIYIEKNDTNALNDKVASTIVNNTNQGIVFNKSKDLITLYNELSAEHKIIFDDLKHFASMLDRVTEFDSKTAITFKIKRKLLCILRIKKGIVEVVFNVADFISDIDNVNMNTQKILSVIKVKTKEDYNFVVSTIEKKHLIAQKKGKQG